MDEDTASGMSLSQRIKPSQAWEPGEICVGGHEFGLIFNCQCCKVGIGRKIARGSEVHQETEQNFGMVIAWRENLYRRMLEPGADPADGIFYVHGILKNVAMRHDPDESQSRSPRHTDWPGLT